MTLRSLLHPKKLWSGHEVFASPCPVPQEPGLYAFYFGEVPSTVPTDDCIDVLGNKLLYVGIAPTKPPQNGRAPSNQRLCHRVRYHYRGNAQGSTLRLSLGLVLGKTLNIRLWRVGSGRRLTFADGEPKLTQWLRRNAFVTWIVHPEPWIVERSVIQKLSLPLNLDMNAHPFRTVLSGLRSDARRIAMSQPIWTTV